MPSVIPNVALKLNKNCVPPESLPKLKKLSQFVDEIANVRHNPRLPWVGSAAFSHKGGQHVNAVQKLARSYEHVEPALVGNKRTVLISDLAGKSNIVLKAQELGFKIHNDTPELKTILARIKEREHQGYEYEAAEGSLALLIRKILKHEEAPFTVSAYHVSMRRDGLESVVEATVKVRVGRQVAHTVSEGDGPVNALDRALRAALAKFFPQLNRVTLIDYKVRILTSDRAEMLRIIRDANRKKEVDEGFTDAADPLLDKEIGTAAKTRVLIQSTDGKEEWGTVGVDDNIIEASLQALVDSMEYRLMKK